MRVLRIGLNALRSRESHDRRIDAMASAMSSARSLGAFGSRGAAPARFRDRQSPRRAAAASRVAKQTVAFVDVVDSETGVILKPFEEGMAKVHLFGVSHMTNNFEAAEHILASKPRSVVVETGLCKSHQAHRGVCFNFQELFTAIHMMGDPGGMAAEESLTFITRVAHKLRLEEKPLEKSPFWAQMKTQLPAEALVYAAAFAVDARLVFGDRPKDVTYRRLVSVTTLAQLDETFGNQSARNYRLLLPEDHPQAKIPPPSPGDQFEKICIDERDAILAHTIREEAAMADAGPGAVVAVVGSDHLAGVEARWDAFVTSGGSDGALAEAELDDLLAAPAAATEDIGQRLAIMQRLLGLRCTESLVGDAMQALDDDMNKLVGDEIIAFNATSELYGSARMLLSCVEDVDLRAAVIGGFKCEMEEVLEPVRAVRPSKGGTGWSEDAIVWLRTSSSVDLAPLCGGD